MRMIPVLSLSLAFLLGCQATRQSTVPKVPLALRRLPETDAAAPACPIQPYPVQPSATHDNLGKVQEFAGTITGDVEGTPYTGDFKRNSLKRARRSAKR